MQTYSCKSLLISFSNTHSRPVLQAHKTALIRVLRQQVPTQAASWPAFAQREREPKQ